MIQFSPRTLFVLLSISLFFSGYMLSVIIDEGLKSGAALFYQLGGIVPSIIASGIFFNKLYGKHRKV